MSDPIGFGKITDLSNEDYHMAEAVSHSRLEAFRRRPALYWLRYVERSLPPKGRNRDFDFGIAAHALILEGVDVYHAQTAVWTGGNKTKNRGAWQDFAAANSDKLILTPEEDVAVFEMQAAIMQHPEARQLFSGGESEVSWRVKSRALPIPLQCRTDKFNGRGCALTEGRPFVADLKTTPSLDDAEYRNFLKSFVEYGYHRQGGFYSALLRDLGVELQDFFFVAVEKEAPYGVDVYRMSPEAINLGLAETLFDLKRLAECYATDKWPNRPHGVNTIDVPEWYLKKNPIPQLQ
jgi:hypothetical protein